MMRIVSEEEFRLRVLSMQNTDFNHCKAVTGPGRSGAIAAVYVSHLMGLPFIPFKNIPSQKITPLLIVDTAVLTGRTLRKASKWYRFNNIDNYTFHFYEETRGNIVRFWYESCANQRKEYDRNN